MTERTLTVRLRAVADGYTRTLEQAARKADEFAGRAERVRAWSDQAQRVGKGITAGITLPIAAAGAAAVAVVGDFDASMREVQALTGASAGEMDRMSEAAIRMGATTQFSATEAADALSQLIKGGFDAAQAYESLPGVMQLAAAAGLDIASAADIATNVMSTMGLEVSDLSRVNDLLSQTANSSDTDVRELGEAFKYVGPVARGAGLELEDTTAILAVLAENGIRGSQAGTSLRGMLSALLGPTAKAKQWLDGLGVSVVDGTGKLRPMVDVLGDLTAAGVTTADLFLYFPNEVAASLQAMMGAGVPALERMQRAMAESGGVAQDLADAKMGGLNGSIEQLKGSLETLAIRLGQAGLTDFVMTLAGAAGGLADTLGELPPGAQRAGLAIAGIAAASGPAIWAMGKVGELYRPVLTGVQSVIAKFQGLRVQMALARMDGMTTGRALLSMFGPGAALVFGTAAIAATFYVLSQRAKEAARAQTDAGTAAEGLAESAGIALQELGRVGEEGGRAAEGTRAFKDANREALMTLRELGDEADQQGYLREIGYQMVLRGASPEDALEEVRRLARAAGVEVPVDLTVANIGDFENQVRSSIQRARRVVEAEQRGGWFDWNAIGVGLPGRQKNVGLADGIVAELDAMRKAASAEWDTGNFGRFVQLMGESESALGDNADAINYLTDEAMKDLGGQFGFSTGKAANLRDMLQQVASRATNAEASEERLARRILDRARAMDGGATSANLARAALELTGNAAARAGDQAAAGSGGVDQFGNELDAAAQQAQANADAVKAAEDALKSYLDTLRAGIDPLFGMLSAVQSNAQAQWDVIAAENELARIRAEEPGNALGIAEAERRVAEARAQSAQSALDVTTASTELRYAVENGTVSLDAARLMLLNWTAQGLISQETAAYLSEQFGIAALQAYALGHEVEGAKVQLQHLDGTTATVTITRIEHTVQSQSAAAAASAGDVYRHFGAAGGRAKGGPVWPGTWLVGEEGPELLRLHGSGEVIPAGPTAGLLRSAASPTMTAAGGSFTDARIVGRLDRLEAAVTGIGGGDVFNITESRNPRRTAAEVARSKRAARFLTKGRA